MLKEGTKGQHMCTNLDADEKERERREVVDNWNTQSSGRQFHCHSLSLSHPLAEGSNHLLA